MQPQLNPGYFTRQGPNAGQELLAQMNPYYQERYFFQEGDRHPIVGPASYGRGLVWGPVPQYPMGNHNKRMEVEAASPLHRRIVVSPPMQGQGQFGGDPEYDTLMSKFSKFLQAERQDQVADSQAQVIQNPGILSPDPSNAQTPVAEVNTQPS